MNTSIKTTRARRICLWIGTLLHFALSSASLLAQDTPFPQIEELDTIIPFSQSMSNYIMPLDKRYITTGLLADKAYPYVALDSFDGETDSLITFQQWKQVHRQLYLAAVTENDTILSPEYLKQIAKGMRNRGVVPIALMNLKYNAFKPYAMDSNLIRFSDGKFYDVRGRTESPYFEKRLFAATVYQDRIYNGRVTFRIENELFLNNSSESVSSVEIDFGDGRGRQNYSLNNLLNNNITIRYLEEGTKTITIRMTLSDQTVLQTKTRIILAPRPEVEPDEILDVTGLLYNGKRGTGKAYILYGCGNNGKLRKPIIVSDGFDPGNQNNFDSLYKMLNEEHFVEKMLAESYDFVILDYTDGADYIQRNAFVLVSLIETVNDRLRENHSASKLIVIGPSMGGLLTRYALNFMEQHPQNYDHNTGLYVSFDSPHLGANIPLGDQHWIEFFATNTGNEVAIESIEKLNTIAARQMLIYHFTATQDNKAYPHQERISFLNDPYITNWPSRCRKIAIANGSGDGTKLFEAHDQMIEYNYALGIVKGNTWAVPTNDVGVKKIFEGKIPDEFIFWGSIPSHYIKSKIKVKETQPYDGAPGGTYNVNALIASADTGGNGDIQTEYPNICFIPIISSLALQNTTDVNYNVHSIPGYPYPSSNITPFDAIYAPDENQKHVKVDTSNIAWIMKEIGAMNMYLQNKTVYEATDFEARNSITTGHNVVSYIPEGDFVVQNSTDEVVLHSEGVIRLMDGTHLMPWEMGVVRLCISDFPCESMFRQMENPLRSNFDDGEPEYVQQKPVETQESIAQTHAEKLPRNHPNPCGDFTTIEYELEKDAKVEIDVYSLMGIKLMSVEDRHNTGAGRYSTTINTSSLPSGMYIVVVRANGETNGVLKMQVNQ